MDAKEPLDNPHEIHFAPFGQQTTEEGFGGRVFGEIDKVINVETKWEWAWLLWGSWVLWILNKASVKTRIFKRWGEIDGSEDCIDFIIPMTWIAPKTIEGAK
jgi:hypothetical protein